MWSLSAFKLGWPGRAGSNGFQRLILFNWPISIVAIAAGLIVSFFLFGFWYPYWRIADMDFMVVYNAFLLNDGLQQEFFDHPGYLSILFTSAWLRFLHTIGILDVHALSALPPVSERIGFELAWARAVQAGRLVSLAIAVSFVTAFAVLLRRLVGDWRIGVIGALLLAFSGGLAMQARIMRTELLAAGLTTIALLLLLNAARAPPRALRPLLVGLAGLLSTLALLNKVQVIFLICAIPVIVLPFGSRTDQASAFWRDPARASLALAALAAGAILLAIPAAGLVSYGLSTNAMTMLQLRPLVGGASGIYQAGIAIWIALGMLAFAVTWRIGMIETLAAGCALAGGVALGLLALELNYAPQNVIVVLNPLEHMFAFAASSSPQLAGTDTLLSGPIVRLLFEAVPSMLARRTFILHSSPRPTIFLEWLVIAGTIIALKRGERKLALQAGVLMLTVWGIDTLGTLRGLKIEYFILTDPLVVVAAALLIAKLTDLQDRRWAYPIGATLIAAHIVVSHAEPVKHSLMRSGPEESCVWHSHYLKRAERFPFCPQ